MRALFVTLVLAATATPVVHGQQPAPKPADGTAHRTEVNECDCGTAYRTQRDWLLHRPSTPAERAETGRLNQEFLETSRAAARASAPPPDSAQLAYQEKMKNYRALTQSYERRMRDYNRLHARADLQPDVAERNWQDAARLDPAQSGSGNGY